MTTILEIFKEYFGNSEESTYINLEEEVGMRESFLGYIWAWLRLDDIETRDWTTSEVNKIHKVL